MPMKKMGFLDLHFRNEMKYPCYCLITHPPRGGPTPAEIDPYERDAHNWLEPEAKRLEDQHF